MTPSKPVIGWTDSHLHRFEKDGKHWGVPEEDEDDAERSEDELLVFEPEALSCRLTRRP